MQVFCAPWRGPSALFFLLPTLVWSATAAAASQSAIPWRSDLRQAAAEVASVDKPMLITVSTSWCAYCKKMSRETFCDEQIVNHIRKCFVPVQLDGDVQRAAVQSLGVRSYPTTVIVSPKMQIVSKIRGFRTASQLGHDLSGLCSPESSRERVESLRKPSVFADVCPVSPMVDATFVKGDPQIQLAYRGFALSFASAEYREAFRQEPHRYWPMADGYCVVSAIDDEVLRQGNLRLGVVYHDRIWLFATEAHLARFQGRPDFYLQALDTLARRNATAQ